MSSSLARFIGVGIITTIASGAIISSAAPGQPPQRIPLREGLTIVTALNDPTNGDYESIKVIMRADEKIVRLRYSAEAPAPSKSDEDNPFAALLGGALGGGSKPKAAKPADGTTKREMQHINVTRTVRREDLKSAHEYRWIYQNDAPEMYPGTTALGLSTAALDELKAGKASALKTPQSGLLGALGGMLGGLLGEAAKSKELDEATNLSGTLTRVEASAVPFKVIVNDEPTELPAIHARGRLGEEDAEFWLLDDPENPLALRWVVGENKLQVIKISFPPTSTTTTSTSTTTTSTTTASTTAARIEHDLEKDGRAIVYGIYFDFASDRIKEESQSVLKEIAQVLQEHPTWALAVEGHTDNIGGDPYNLDLSKRRSAAVKQALVASYKIDGKRLQTSGYGASRPKDRNDTLEGRARNRRVELVKAG